MPRRGDGFAVSMWNTAAQVIKLTPLPVPGGDFQPALAIPIASHWRWKPAM